MIATMCSAAGARSRACAAFASAIGILIISHPAELVRAARSTLQFRQRHQPPVPFAGAGATLVGCTPSGVPNSNASAGACVGELGDECFYTCSPRYLKVGRHVCQYYSPIPLLVEAAAGAAAAAAPVVAINNTFFGGSCVPLCTPPVRGACPAGSAPVRYNTTYMQQQHQQHRGKAAPAGAEADTSCLATECHVTTAEALGNLTRGAYLFFQYARHPSTGIYIDHVDPRLPPARQTAAASVDSTAVGIVAEVIGTALGYITLAEAEARVLLSLRALSNKLPGFALDRHPTAGWFPTFINAATGASAQPGVYATDSTGLAVAGALFARTFFTNTYKQQQQQQQQQEQSGRPGRDGAGDDNRMGHAREVAATHTPSPSALEIIALADAMYQSVDWLRMFCTVPPFNTTAPGTSTTNGTCIPWLFEGNDDGCSDCQGPAPDGFYYFSELYWLPWLAHQKACGSSGAPCADAPVAAMWERWQGRRIHPDYHYGGRDLLTQGPCFITQLPYYLISSFNADPLYTALLTAQWQAEWAFFNSSLFHAGEDGRYGLGAGPTPTWCASGNAYWADQLINISGWQACRVMSVRTGLQDCT